MQTNSFFFYRKSLSLRLRTLPQALIFPFSSPTCVFLRSYSDLNRFRICKKPPSHFWDFNSRNQTQEMAERTSAQLRISWASRTPTSTSTLPVCHQFGRVHIDIKVCSAGAGGEEPKSKGPSFVGKPRIIPKDGGALIVMECKVKSPTPPIAKWVTSSAEWAVLYLAGAFRWMKDGVPLQMGGLYHAVFTDLGDQTFLCQLEIRVSDNLARTREGFR